MNKNGKILIIYPTYNEDYGLWSDLKSDERVYVRSTSLHSLNSIIKQYVRLIHLSNKLNKIISMPLKHIWYNFSDYKKLLPHISQVIVIDLALENSLLVEISKDCRNNSIPVSLFLINTLDSSVRAMEAVRSNMRKVKWDTIYTFDRSDAIKYNMKYLPFCYYSKMDIPYKRIPKNDLYVIATFSPDRSELFLSLYKMLTGKGCKCDFNFCRYFSYTPSVPEGIHINSKRIPYRNTLDAMLNSKTILEIIRGEQTGPTLRYFEAVCYNKKLLTNNPEIVNFPYYDSRFMKCFSSISDIDIDWIKENIDVDYHYQGDFSPCHMIDCILNC